MRSSDALLYARTQQHRARVAAAQEVIKRAFVTAGSRWYIAFSGGKDSTCLLALVREQRSDTPAIFIDDEWNFPETITLIQSTPNCERVAMTLPHGEWFTAFAKKPKVLPVGAIWSDAPAKENIVWHARKCGWNASFVGVRADENVKRRIMLRKYGVLYFAQNHRMWQAYPLAWWTVMDVWAYIFSHGLDYNRAYDRLEAIGIPVEQQRIGPFAVERVLGYGQLAILKCGWPELFNRFAEHYPEARNYV